MNKTCVITVVLVLLFTGAAAQADVFNMGPGLTNLETVTVGDPGNVADTRYADPGYGSVGYDYRMGKYEVTAAQYADFLNAKAKSDPYGLYNIDMWDNAYGCKISRSGTDGDYKYSVASDWANRPVNYVSYWDALRFANWVNNGQGNGDTETGTYTLNGYLGHDGRYIERNVGSRWFIANEDEWYKAAYYKGSGTDAGYWEYATQSDSPPSNDFMSPDPGNNANFYQNGFTVDSPYWRTNVGEFENSESAYGTFDQSGNVFEWNEAIVYEDGDYSYRGQRGGSFGYDDTGLGASSRGDYLPGYENEGLGFRIAAAIPEPSSLIVMATGFGALALYRRPKS